MRIRFAIIWLPVVPLLCIGLASPGLVVASAPTDNADEIAIRLPAVDGRLAKADLLTDLGRIAGLNLNALPWLLPDGDIDLKKSKVERRLAWLNRALGRYATARIVHEPASDEPALEIKIDRRRLSRDKERVKTRARQVSLKVLDPRGKLRATSQHGLILDEQACRLPIERLVVAVHGLNSNADLMSAFVSPLREQGFNCAQFCYPNDGSIADSAWLLSRELKALKQQHPECEVSIVAFSMGGLVARATIEDPKLDPGNVDRLIMIAPPNHGSVCARWAHGLDIVEHVVVKRQLKPRHLLVAALADGTNEAQNDLRPDSRFLRDLNARERNKSVRYSILLGEGGELSEEQVSEINQWLTRFENTSSLVKVFGPKLDACRAEFAELCEPGDGAVTVQRGRLDGVEDIEILRFNHWSKFSNTSDPAIAAVHAAIAKRLR
jgi:pimeloyl-ACP methyl ester carboxylesterase